MASPATEAGIDAAWEELAALAKGPVLRPADPGFAERTALFNRRYAHKRPAAVLRAADTNDVRVAIDWCRDRDVPLVARSGGHSFAGYSVGEGLVVDLGALSTVSVNPDTRRVVVGGGARVGQVNDALRPYDIAFSTGTNPLVGIGGLVLGGGCEYLSRAYGLTADALVETTIVTADGEVRVCDDQRHSDLFWACRGGGGGNFGINVSFTFQTVAAPDVATFDLTWDWGDALAVVRAFQRLMADAPNALSVRIGLSTHGPDASSASRNRTVTAVGQLLGSAEELRELLAGVRDEAAPRAATVQDASFWEAKSAMTHATVGEPFAMRTRYIKEPVADAGIETMIDFVGRWPGSSNPDGGGIGMFAWGGAINDVASDATAFVHRDSSFLASMDTSWLLDDTPVCIDANLAWLNAFYEAMGEHLSAASYVNFPDPDLADWTSAYHGANYARLVDVKRAYDPDGLFRFAQSIRP